MGERGFQSRITLSDIQRVGVIGNIEQVTHRRLAAATAVFQAHLLLSVPTVAEVHGGCNVQHIAYRIGIMTIVALHEVGALRLDEHAYAQLVFGLDDAQRHTQVVDIVLVFREPAQRIALVIIKRMTQWRKIAVPSAIHLVPSVEEGAWLVGTERRACHQRIIA